MVQKTDRWSMVKLLVFSISFSLLLWGTAYMIYQFVPPDNISHIVLACVGGGIVSTTYIMYVLGTMESNSDPVAKHASP